MIRFACPGCSSVYSAAEEHAGKRTTCKKCGAKFLIPNSSDAEPASVPPPSPTMSKPLHPLPRRRPSANRVSLSLRLSRNRRRCLPQSPSN